MSAEGPWVYRVSRLAVWLAARLLFRIEPHGAEHVPKEGACILVSNHASYLDPPMLGCPIRHRLVHFMARDSLARWRFVQWLFNQYQCVLIDRSRGDVAALRKGLKALKEGGVLAVFPEGTRSPDGRLQEPKGGIGFLIAKAGVPVVPAYIDGTFRAWNKQSKFPRPAKVRVFYGSPVSPEEWAETAEGQDGYAEISRSVMRRIAALRPD